MCAASNWTLVSYAPLPEIVSSPSYFVRLFLRLVVGYISGVSRG